MCKFYCLLLLLLVSIFGMKAESVLDNADNEPQPVPTLERQILTLSQAKHLGVIKDNPNANILRKASLKGENSSTVAYGFGLYGYVSFSLTPPYKFSVVDAFKYDVSAGAKVGSSVYLIQTTVANNGSLHSVGLLSFDLATRKVRNVASMDYNGPIIVDMAYSKVTGKMYCLGVISNKEALYTIDLSTGALTKVSADYNKRYMAMATNRAGLIYVVDKNGVLSTVSPLTGVASEVGGGNLNKTASYISSMDLDVETNTLYWALCDSNGKSYIVKIDPTTGAGKVMGGLGASNEEIIGMHIVQPAVSEDAPRPVSNMDLIPDAAGALKATLKWTNPVATVSGNVLSHISKVNVYVNGTLYKELTTSPGADNDLEISSTTPGYMRVGVSAVSGENEGEVEERMYWVGSDAPREPTNLSLVRTNAKYATLSWNPPTTGVHDGYLKVSSLKYRITRKSISGDSVIVAKTYRKDNNYLDSTITELNRYNYTIQSLSTDYGETAYSESAVAGPATKIPFISNFGDLRGCLIWNTKDNNNDGSTWTYYTYGKYYYHSPKGGADCDDWLITPPMELDADSTYYVYFEFRTGLGEYYPKHLQVTLGTSLDEKDHKVIWDYRFASKITEQARIALPISKTGEYYIGIHDVSTYNTCSLRLANFCVIVKHTGWVTGKVTDASGVPVEGVTVTIPNSNIVDTTDATGAYKLDFIPEGKYKIEYSKLDWETRVDLVEFEKDKESVHNVVLERLPRYTLKGVLTDVNGTKIANADVELSGYGDTRNTRTDADGAFTLESVARHKYQLKIYKIKYDMVRDSVEVEDNKDLSRIMNPKLLVPSEYSVVTDAKSVKLSWKQPREVFRHDNGVFESQLGSLAGNEKTVNGAVFREPAVLKSISWVTTSYQGPHNKINLWIFDVTSDFKPTNKILFNAMNVATKGDEVWNSYELPSPVEAPNGYFLGVSYSDGMSSLATDSGTDPDYPFVPYTNYASADYTTNVWRCLDASFVKRNHLIRATGDELGENAQVFDYKYVVWRFKEDDFLEKNNWVMLTDAAGTSETSMVDDVTALDAGGYVYAIAAVYPSGKYSEILYSDVVLVESSGVSATRLADDFTVAPNPVSAVLKTNMMCDAMELYSISGAMCLSASDTDTIDVSALASGVYVLKATIDGKTIIKQIIKK